MTTRLVPAVRQRLVQLRSLLDRARDNGEDMSEVLHVAKLMLVNQNVEFGSQSLSGLLALACDCAKTLENGSQSDDDNRRTFESLDRWLQEATLIVASMRESDA